MFLKGPFRSVQPGIHKETYPDRPKFQVYSSGVDQVKAVLTWMMGAVVE